MKYPFRQVDVFGTGPFSGNPVAVVLNAESVDTELLRRVSVWSNLSECTFVVPATASGADYGVRIFSLGTELPFAGHPTLGTARAWLDAGGKPNQAGEVVQQCGAGLVPVRVDEDLTWFLAPPRARSGEVDQALLSDVVAILGVDPGRVIAAEWLDNGPPWIGVLVDSAQTVRDIRPDASGYPGQWMIGVIGPTGHDEPASLELRAFFSANPSSNDPSSTGPLLEDPVTGSLNAAAAQWLLETGRVTVPYLAQQGSVMGRSGQIHLDADDKGLWVGGRTQVAISGVIEL